MSKPVISVEHLTKQYDLGIIGTGTISRDLNRWWAHLRKQPDPYTRIGQKDTFERIGETILALDDVSFTVHQGDTLGIIGKNGAGKSTLLKILSRVTAPSSGVVKVKGRIGSLLEVGTGFHPELTGRENVYLNGAILGMKKAEVTRKFDEIVNFSGVEKFIDTPVKRFSSGMYVRLAFAVAAHLDPEILIVDEVLAVGDAEFQKKCLGKMGDIAGEGRTVLFVSHNMGAIQHLCHQAIVLEQGQVKFEGMVNEAIDYYQVSGTKKGDSNIDIEITKKRTGSGEIKIQSIELKNTKGQFIDSVTTGQTFDILFHYYAKEKIPINAVNFGFDCFTSMGQRIFIQSMNYSGFIKEGKIPLSGTVVCRLLDLPLAQGTYFITSVVKINKSRVDVVENAFKLDVTNGNFLNSTISLTSNEVVCLVKGAWKILDE